MLLSQSSSTESSQASISDRSSPISSPSLAATPGNSNQLQVNRQRWRGKGRRWRARKEEGRRWRARKEGRREEMGEMREEMGGDERGEGRR